MGRVTLTFDNGPCPETTPQVLQQLGQRNLTAYFCLIGAQLEKGQAHVDVAKETRTQGHILVNHSFTHGVALGDDPSRTHAEREISDTHKLLDRTFGDWGPRWFRPFGRGGEIGQHLLSEPAVAELKSLGYSVLLWNSVPRDWEDVDGWMATASQHIAAHEHTVLVLHDLATGAMTHLGGFLDACLERGDEFTMDLPDAVVPMRGGVATWTDHRFAGLVT